MAVLKLNSPETARLPAVSLYLLRRYFGVGFGVGVGFWVGAGIVATGVTATSIKPPPSSGIVIPLATTFRVVPRARFGSIWDRSMVKSVRPLTPMTLLPPLPSE